MAVERTGFSASMANVASAIRRAAQATGASFDYLLATAKVESNLDPNVKAARSSATGLFQFIEQTWLATLKRAGPALGYGNVASAIVQTPGGGFAVADPSMRDAVLNLRRDPATNAAMAEAARMRTAVLAGQAPARAASRVTGPAADPAGTFDSLAMISAVPVARTAENRPVFHSLFQTEGRGQPISPLLGAIWGGSNISEISRPAAGERPAPVRSAEQREDVDLRGLYQNGRLNIRGLFDGTS